MSTLEKSTCYTLIYTLSQHLPRRCRRRHVVRSAGRSPHGLLRSRGGSVTLTLCKARFHTLLLFISDYYYHIRHGMYANSILLKFLSQYDQYNYRPLLRTKASRLSWRQRERLRRSSRKPAHVIQAH